MKLRFPLSILAIAVLQAACGGGDDGSGSSTNASPSEATIFGTVPGTIVEAFGDNGSYYAVDSIDNGTTHHPFELKVPAGVGFQLVMKTGEGEPEEVVQPLGFRDSTGAVRTRLMLADGEVIDLGHVPLFLGRNAAAAHDLDDDGVLDQPLVIDAGNPLMQSDADGDGMRDYDDPDHGGYHYDDNTINPQDEDDDGIPNKYDRDYKPKMNDEDGDGLPDRMDANPRNDKNHGHGKVPEDCDEDGYSDDDHNRDGYHDDDHDRDGYHDDDYDRDGYHDDDDDDDGHHDDDDGHHDDDDGHHDDDDGNNGNDDDGVDESNPSRGHGGPNGECPVTPTTTTTTSSTTTTTMEPTTTTTAPTTSTTTTAPTTSTTTTAPTTSTTTTAPTTSTTTTAPTTSTTTTAPTTSTTTPTTSTTTTAPTTSTTTTAPTTSTTTTAPTTSTTTTAPTTSTTTTSTTTTTTTTAAPTTTTTTLPPPDGQALYTTYCQDCHTNRPVTGATAAEIQAAIDGNRGGMRFLSSILTSADIQAIADFLAP